MPSARLSSTQPIDALQPLVLALSSSSVHAQDLGSPSPTSYTMTSWTDFVPRCLRHLRLLLRTPQLGLPGSPAPRLRHLVSHPIPFTAPSLPSLDLDLYSVFSAVRTNNLTHTSTGT